VNNKQQIDYNNNRKWIYRAFVGLCFLAGIAARVYGAWAGRYISNPDCGIVALMAKHVAEGGAWPVFFYGQAYMGSLEPLISALLCRLFGISGFMVCLGTAVAAIATLPIIYLWARDAGGKSGALAALALCAVGPYFYFMFQFAPRGGYMMMSVFGLACMWLSAKTAFELQNNIQVRWTRYFLIGLFAGLGWWTTPLIISALLASVVILAFGLRKKIFSVMPLYGLAGFMLGSLPFWIWNIGHQWQSFAMFSASGGISLNEGLNYLILRYNRLIGLQDWMPLLRKVFMWGYLIFVGLGLLVGIKDIRYKKLSLRGSSTLTAGLFILFSVLFFVRSSFATMNTARYLVPIIPALAILIGSMASYLNKKMGAVVAAIPVIFLLSSYWPAFPDLHGQSSAAPIRSVQARKLQTYLTEHNIRAVYSHFMDHSLNFNMNEKIIVTTLRGDRYGPYAEQAELSDNIGFLRYYGHINNFIRNTGGTVINSNVGGYGVTYQCEPPKGGLVEVNLNEKCKITDHTGRNCSKELLDRNVNTVWSGTREHEKQEWVLINITNPVVLRRIRLLGNGAEHFPRNIKVEVREAGKDEWTTLHDNHSVTGYFWSGLRPYWWGRRHRQEYTLKDMKVDAIRIVSTPTGREPLLWQLKEIQFFAPAPDNNFDPVKSMPVLISKLKQYNISRLFADRWESNQVFDLLNGQVRVELSSRVFNDYKWSVNTDITGNHSAILTRDYDAVLTRRNLAVAGVVAAEDIIGGWVLFHDFKISSDVGVVAKPLVWTGFTLLVSDIRKFDIVDKVEFSNGIVLDGISVEPRIVSPGGSFNITFCWRKPSDVVIEKNLSVFVHFVADSSIFQSDYPLSGFMPEIMVSDSMDQDVCYISRTVQVPKDAATGARSLRLGLYDTLYGNRRNLKTSLETRKMAVIIPDIITVVE
jgi:hypothetical protein